MIPDYPDGEQREYPPRRSGTVRMVPCGGTRWIGGWMTLRALLWIPLVGWLLIACTATREASAVPSALPYAGWQDRPIRALAPERVQELQAGQGLGYALAAELNHHPGPQHVLQLAGDLELSPGQVQAVERIGLRMRQDAQRLGQQLLAQEAELDQRFRAGAVTTAELGQRTTAIASVEGQLRATHLT